MAKGEMKRWMSFGSIMFAFAILRQYSTGFYYTWATLRRYFPLEIRRLIEHLFTSRFTTLFYPYVHITIHEINGSQFTRNQAYYAVEAYLSSFSGKTATKLKAEMQSKNRLVVSMGEQETVRDEYRGVEVWWDSRKVVRPTGSTTSSGHSVDSERRYYILTFHRRHREMILESYLEHVIEEGNELELRNRQRKLYTNNSDARTYSSQMWRHIEFEHPATFETMAMDSKKKQEMIEDLLTFRESKDYYARIGKTWKRGYLLYGPPGTGKSTMIAAMANLLNYDVYDLELTTVKDNTVLRQLLTNTTSKSIIVIEDIDCSLHLTGQRKKPVKPLGGGGGKVSAVKKPSSTKPKEESGSEVTLSGLLNFIDGLWSACGGERIIVFTTNYVEKLDPALTRRGRMDKHIELSYCSFEGFKVLAKNYLELETHPMFEEIEELMEVTQITPADVAENLMPKSKIKDAEVCLSSLVEALKKAREEQEKKAREEEEKKAREEEKEAREEEEITRTRYMYV